jgi:hypothetical protein
VPVSLDAAWLERRNPYVVRFHFALAKLGERQQVTVTISDRKDVSQSHPLMVSPEEWSDAAQDDISLDEVRRALATIRGSLSEAVLEERRAR